nr:ORF3 tegument protein [Ovine gammaherpesvirus 2]
MITRELLLLGYTAGLTPLESVAAAALKNLPGLEGLVVQAKQVYAVSVFASPKPLRHHQAKIETLKSIQLALVTFDGQQFLQISPQGLKGEFTFIYGPDLNGFPTTQSEDLTALLESRHPTELIFDVERIQQCRILFFSGPGSSNLDSEHYGLLTSILCQEFTMHYPIQVGDFDASLSLYTRGYVSGLSRDEVHHFMVGSDELQLRDIGSSYVRPGMRLTDINLIPLPQILRYIDVWSIILRFPGLENVSDEIHPFKHISGLSYITTTLNNRLGALGCLQKACLTSFVCQPHASFLGLINEPLSGWEGSEVSLEDSFALMKYAGSVEAYCRSLNHAALPVVQGFVTSSPTLKGVRPMAFTGCLAVTGELPYRLHKPTKTDLDDAHANRRELMVFQVGHPSHNKGRLDQTGSTMYSESGRHAQILQRALAQLFSTRESESVIYVSDHWSDYEKLTLFKLSNACGELGLVMSARGLPANTQRLLKKWSYKNREYNSEIIKTSWLKVTTASAFIVVSTNADEVMFRRITRMLLAWGCPVHFVGQLTQNTSDIVVQAHNKYGELVSIPFKRHCPKQLSMGTEDTPPASDPQAIPWPPLEAPMTEDLLLQVLRHPTVGSKAYIVHHMDRCGNGRVAQQPGVGPFDLPLSDYSVTIHNLVESMTGDELLSPPDKFWSADWRTSVPVIEDQYSLPGSQLTDHMAASNLGLTHNTSSDYHIMRETPRHGTCVGLGEKTCFTQANPPLGALLAITESLTNLVLGPISNFNDTTVGLTVGIPQGYRFRTEINHIMAKVRRFCAVLEVDFHFNSAERNGNLLRAIVATANTPCVVPYRSTKPYFQKVGSTILHLTLLNQNFLSGSIFCKITGQGSDHIIDPAPEAVKNLLMFMLSLKEENLVLSGHDVSDGGLIVTVCEMMIASGLGATFLIPEFEDPADFCFSETPGFVIEVDAANVADILTRAHDQNIWCRPIGTVVAGSDFIVFQNDQELMRTSVPKLRHHWSLFSRNIGLLYRNEGEEELMEDSYGNYELRLTVDPYCIRSLPLKRPNVLVLLLPGCGSPDALLAALTNSGFLPEVLVASDNKYHSNAFPAYPAVDNFRIGVILYGSSHIDSDVGDSAVKQWLVANRHVYKNLRQMLSRKTSFSLAIGQLACRILLATKAIGFDPSTNQAPFLLPNISRRYESRWLNFKIPEDTKALALRDLRGCVIPCWAQGTHLGFSHHNKSFFGNLVNKQLVAAYFHNQQVHSGPATKYPLNPTESEHPYAGICSEDGRHLALLFDPCLAYHAWQWQHTKGSNGLEIAVSPWKLMFYRLYQWTKFQYHYQRMRNVNLQLTFNRSTHGLQFPNEEVRGAVPAAVPQFIVREDLQPNP